MGRLTGKTAVITGSGRSAGLGAAIARRLASDGASIVLSDFVRDEAAGRELIELAADVGQAGSPVTWQSCDVRDWSQVEALAQHAAAAHGTLDIWVNNAGVGYIMKPLLTLEPSDWTQVIDVNLTGAFYGLLAAARIMAAAGKGGRIINVASQAAKSGFPDAQAYCSSKHGLVGLVRSAAIDLGAHGITVNNVCPNHVTTDLGAWQNSYFAKRAGQSVEQYLAQMASRIPLGRPGLPADTANLIAFLCSDDAQYITAESVNVSGGEEPH